jgi:hypothetical protein
MALHRDAADNLAAKAFSISEQCLSFDVPFQNVCPAVDLLDRLLRIPLGDLLELRENWEPRIEFPGIAIDKYRNDFANRKPVHPYL